MAHSQIAFTHRDLAYSNREVALTVIWRIRTVTRGTETYYVRIVNWRIRIVT